MNDPKLRELIFRSANEVFEKMISLSVSEEAPSQEPLFNGAIHLCATIGFAGDWNGFISFMCGEKLAYQITSKMLFMGVDDLQKADVWDAMGEIINMIGGRFKAIFADTFNSGIEAFKMSIPSVIMGKNYQLFVVGDDHYPESVMSTENEKFSIKLVLKKVDS